MSRSTGHTESKSHAPCRCEACDAARYRWLRAHVGSNRLPHITQYPPAHFDGRRFDSVQIHIHGLDAAIDAAAIMYPRTDEEQFEVPHEDSPHCRCKLCV